MKTKIMVLMLISFFVCPIGSHAAYIIHLKSGGRFVTPQYWVEDNKMICFFVSGGTMGIEKNTVKAIEKSKFDDESDLIQPKRATQMAVTQPQGETIANKTGPDFNGKKIPGANTIKEKVDVSAYKDKMNELKAEADEARRSLREAIKNKDTATEAKAVEERQKIAIKKRDLTNELKEKNNGKLPTDWDN